MNEKEYKKQIKGFYELMIEKEKIHKSIDNTANTALKKLIDICILSTNKKELMIIFEDVSKNLAENQNFDLDEYLKKYEYETDPIKRLNDSVEELEKHMLEFYGNAILNIISFFKNLFKRKHK